MKSSDAAFTLIKKFEGLRLTSYQCSADKWTIGWGSTRGVKPGMTITMEEASGRLLSDVAGVDEDLARLLRIPLTQNQYDAVASFVFNIGATKFADSTLLRMINDESPLDHLSDQFMRWVYVTNPITGKANKDKGLIRRRKAEKALFDLSLPLT